MGMGDPPRPTVNETMAALLVGAVGGPASAASAANATGEANHSGSGGGGSGGGGATPTESGPKKNSFVDAVKDFGGPAMVSDPTMEHAVIRSMRSYDVRVMPVKKAMVRGHMLPTVKRVIPFLPSQTRKITVEIHGPASKAEVKDGTPLKTKMMQELLEGKRVPDSNLNTETLSAKDVIYVRFLKHHKSGAVSEDDESAGGSKSGEGRSVVSMSTLGITGNDDDGDFVEHSKYQFEHTDLIKRSGRTCELKFGSGNETVVRDIKFKNEQDAIAFERVYGIMRDLESERTDLQIKKYHNSLAEAKQKSAGSGGPDKDDKNSEKINILVDIVSCDDLPVADLISTDAYIIVRMGGDEIHRTKVIPKNLDPVFTVDQNSLFMIDMTPEEFFSSAGGVTFTVKDFDALGTNDILGRVVVPLDDLLHGTGERQVYDIVADKAANTRGAKAKLNLRFKPATDGDIEFMRVLRENNKGLGIYAKETFLPPRAPEGKMLKRQTKRNTDGELMHRTKPFPDPDRPEETKWLTSKELQAEALKPSTRWIEAGSGDLGRLYVEIIACDGLPNMDALTLNPRDRTDAFACLVYEDIIINTDVLGDSCSPRWMPWSRRAFAFNISHPSSQVFLGLFDYDPITPLQMLSVSPGSLHDPIARCLIHVSNFLPETEYTLTYPLYYGELKKHRQETKGTVTLRLRLEWKDFRQSMIKGISPPEQSYVACSNPSNFAVSHYTLDGVQDFHKWNMDTFAQHIEELQTYYCVVEMVKSAAMSLLLWRSLHQIDVFGLTLNVPIHSLTALSWGIIMSYDFNTYPSFVLFSIGWIFLACNENALRHPSPWHQSRRYWSLTPALIFGKTRREKVPKNYNLEAIKAYEQKQKEVAKREKEEAEMELKHQEEMQKEMSEADVDITSGSGRLFDFNVNPLKETLYPIQLQLGGYVVFMRIAASIVKWQETYYAFWITTASFVSSIVLIWVPWGWLLRWIFRILVFVVLGPWMALIERFYFGKDPNMSEEEHQERIKERIKSNSKQVMTLTTGIRIRKERALKLQAMKKFMFGKFLLEVPRFCEDLYADKPNPESFAEPYDRSKAKEIKFEDRKFGQHLRGDLIPIRDIQEAEVKREKVPARKNILQSAPGKTIDKGRRAAEKVPLLGRFARKEKYGTSK